MATRLTPRQQKFFRDEGYLLFDQPVFAPAKFDALKDHFERKLVEYPPLRSRSAFSSTAPPFT